VKKQKPDDDDKVENENSNCTESTSLKELFNFNSEFNSLVITPPEAFLQI
jgi:hypothetical protein